MRVLPPPPFPLPGWKMLIGINAMRTLQPLVFFSTKALPVYFVIMIQARFKRRTLHVPNLISIRVDLNN